MTRDTQSISNPQSAIRNPQSAIPNSSHVVRNYVRRAVVPREHRIGLSISDESLGLGVELEGLPGSIGDVAQMAEGGGEVSFFDGSVQHCGFALAHGFNEIGIMVSAGFGRRTRFSLLSQEDFIGVVARDDQDPF